MLRLIGFIVVIIILGAIAYWYFVLRKQNITTPGFNPLSGTYTPPTGPTVLPNPINVVIPEFKPGDNVYNNPSYASNDLYIYSYPLAPQSGAYIVGIHHRDWSGPNPIGTFIEKAGSTGFTKIKVNNLQIYTYEQVPGLKKITGDYFVVSVAIKNKPY